MEAKARLSAHSRDTWSQFATISSTSTLAVSKPVVSCETRRRRRRANPLRFAFNGRKRVRNADELVPAIIAQRLVEHLERSEFVVMKRPPIGGAATSRADSSDNRRNPEDETIPRRSSLLG